MSLATASLPSDPDQLRAFAAALQAEIQAKALLIEKLKFQLAVLRRARFGRSSEKLDVQIEQLELLIGDLEETEAEGAALGGRQESAPPPAAKKPSARASLPSHLPIETVTHDAPGVCPTCGGVKFGRLGADEREALEYVPAHFKRVRHVRPKMSCRACETIVQAPMRRCRSRRGGQGLRCSRM